MGNNLQQLLAEDTVQALCRALIHSLWQGLLLAMLTGLIMLLTRRSAAEKRYRLLVGLLCLFVLSFICTLVISLSNPVTIGSIYQNNGAGPSDIWELLNYNLTYVQEHADIVVLVWVAVVLVKSFKILFGLYNLDRLKKTGISRVSAEWEQKLALLAQTMGIKRAVAMLESAVIKVPVIIGYLKPLLLVPIGMLNALSAREVEAILLHELAHVRRRDYLVNLLQSFVETLFFFNPAVLWLSALIRAEREHCCDDVAVDQTKNKILYMGALVHFEEYRAATPGYALALTGKANGMLQRLERMAANRNRSLNKLEVAGLAALMLITCLFIAARPGPALSSTAYKNVPGETGVAVMSMSSPDPLSMAIPSVAKIAGTKVTAEPWGVIFRWQNKIARERKRAESQRPVEAARLRTGTANPATAR